MNDPGVQLGAGAEDVVVMLVVTDGPAGSEEINRVVSEEELDVDEVSDHDLKEIDEGGPEEVALDGSGVAVEKKGLGFGSGGGRSAALLGGFRRLSVQTLPSSRFCFGFRKGAAAHRAAVEPSRRL